MSADGDGGADQGGDVATVALLPVADARRAAELRDVADGLIDARGLWLRVPVAAATRLRALGLRERFVADAAGGLHRPGGRLTVGAMPTDGWRPLRALLRAAAPAALLPGRPPAPLRLALVRAAAERPAAALRCALRALAAWAEDAPALRLTPLRWALQGDDDALVVGDPLPPLPGEVLHAHGALLLPAGWAPDPPIDAGAAARALGLAEGDRALARPDGPWSRIAADALTPLRRSGLRLALRGAQVGP